MTYKQGVWVFGVIVLVTLFVTEIGAFSSTHLGTIIWLIGLMLLAVLSPIWGFCLGKVSKGKGESKFRLRR